MWLSFVHPGASVDRSAVDRADTGEPEHLATVLLLLFAIWAGIGAWFAWLYGVSPRSDRERIEADQGGTGALKFTIRRTGTKNLGGGKDYWVADRLMSLPGVGWCRTYEVTVERAGGARETYEVAVQARMFGLSNVVKIDPRAGE